MKKFLEMIEIAKRQGEIPVLEDKDPLQPYEKAFKSEMFFHFAENAVPFVFTPKNKEPVDIEAGGQRVAVNGQIVLVSEEDTKHAAVSGMKIHNYEMANENNPDANFKDVPDAPFKVFSIEMLGAKESITVPHDDMGPIGVAIEAIVVVEQKPKDCIFFGLFRVYHNDGRISRRVCLSVTLGPVVNAMLERLRDETIGVEHIRERVKIGTGKDKRTATFRRIVHVRPKKLQTERAEGSGREIEWTHRWAVRGHWRKTQQLGKDREGNYCVEGFTWVSEHVKGPEDAPLIQKTRLVQNDNSAKNS